MPHCAIRITVEDADFQVGDATVDELLGEYAAH
jgi:hypothetical protein